MRDFVLRKLEELLVHVASVNRGAMNRQILTSLLAVFMLMTGCDMTPTGERAVTQGCNPVFSPDGKKIAFQRLEGDVF